MDKHSYPSRIIARQASKSKKQSKSTIAPLPIDTASRATPSSAFINFFKSLFGAGVLALPHAMLAVGLQLAVIIFFSLGLACTYSCFLLLESKRMADEIIIEKHEEAHRKHSLLSDPNTSYQAFAEPAEPTTEPALPDAPNETHNPTNTSYHTITEPTEPVLPLPDISVSSGNSSHIQLLLTYEDLSFNLLGSNMSTIIRFTIVTLEVCFCAGFVICILENLHEAIPEIDKNTMALILLPILLLLGQIKWLNELAIFSIIGATIYLVGVIGFSFYYSFENYNPPDDLMTWKYKGIIEFAGTAVYALEGVALVLPCERSLADKSQALPIVSSSLLLYTLICVLYAGFVFASGLITEDCDIVTDCFDGNAANVIRIALSFALILSHPVTLYPATEILEVMLERSGFLDSKPLCDSNKDSELSQPLIPSPSSSDDLTTSDTSHKNNNRCTRSNVICVTLRCFLVTLTVLIGVSIESFSLFSNFIGAVGLTFVGFVVPVLLYYSASRRKKEPILLRHKFAMFFTFIVGVFNVVVTGGSSGYKLYKAF